MIYLDHNATTPVRPEVVEAMARALRDLPGNPSSVHAAGRQAREAVEQARFQVAQFLGALPEEIVFTSGGTEGDNLAIRGLATGKTARGRRRVLTSAIEHPAVTGAVAALAELGFSAAHMPVDGYGNLDSADLRNLLDDRTALVTLSSANHELGNCYPIAEFAAAAHAAGALMHTDAVQAAGKCAIDVRRSEVDAATISAHKIGGPKGVGAIFIRRGLDLPPLLAGGHQERERRGGTENLAGIVGFGVACQIAAAAVADERARLQALRGPLQQRLLALSGARLLGNTAVESNQPGVAEVAEMAERRLPGTLMVAFSGAPGQLVAIGLDLEGVCVSTGAACTSGSLQPSPVLRALGLPPEKAAEGLRISLGWTTTVDDVARLCELLPGVVERVRSATGNAAAQPSLGLQAAAGRRSASADSPGARS